MKEERDYIQDLAEIRSMMERSSKFLSLSGWAGVMAGIYALAGACTASVFLSFNPDSIVYPVNESGDNVAGLPPVIGLALLVLVLAIGTAVFLSGQKARIKGESIWNATSKRMTLHMAAPLIAGGILILLVMVKGLSGLAAPLSLLFYGLALINASIYTYREVRSFGIILVILGLAGSWYAAYGLWLWAIGFGLLHIVYGIYLHFKYER